MKYKKKNPDCSDKNSTHYFMCHMTQKEWEKRSGLSKEKQSHEFSYHFNKIRMKELFPNTEEI